MNSHLRNLSLSILCLLLTSQTHANESLFSRPSAGLMTQQESRDYCSSFQLALPSRAQFTALATARGARYNSDQTVDVRDYRAPQDANLLSLFWSNEPLDAAGQVAVFSGQAGVIQRRDPGTARAAAICYGEAATTPSPFADYLQRYGKENVTGLAKISSRRLSYIFKLVADDSGARLERICSKALYTDNSPEIPHPNATMPLVTTRDLSGVLALLPEGIRDYIAQSFTNLNGMNATITADNSKWVAVPDLSPAAGETEKTLSLQLSEDCDELRSSLLIRDSVFIVNQVAQADAVSIALENGEFAPYLAGMAEAGWKIAKVAGGLLSITRDGETLPLSLGLDILRISAASQATYAISNPPWSITFQRPTAEERSLVQRLMQRP